MDISKLSKEEKAELLRKLKEEENRVQSAEGNLRSVETSVHVRCGK